MTKSPDSSSTKGLTLVLGATGKTGRRVVARLEARGVPVRPGSRSARPPFDWDREASWDACLDGVEAVYVSYAPDLAVPGATDAIRAFVDRAGRHGVDRLVLLSGRGEEEAQATVLDGRNAHLTDGVERALGRPPKDFSTFAREWASGAPRPEPWAVEPNPRTPR